MNPCTAFRNFLTRIKSTLSRGIVALPFLCMWRPSFPSWFWNREDIIIPIYERARSYLTYHYRSIKYRVKEISLLRIRLDDAIAICWDKTSGTRFHDKFVNLLRADRKYWFFYSMLAYDGFHGIRFYGCRTPSRLVKLITSPHRNRLHPYGDNRTMVYRLGNVQEIFTDVCISYMDFRKYLKQLKRSVEGYA